MSMYLVVVMLIFSGCIDVLGLLSCPSSYRSLSVPEYRACIHHSHGHGQNMSKPGVLYLYWGMVINPLVGITI